jgi:glycosyltransferase involved in cell wall biosynthesis
VRLNIDKSRLSCIEIDLTPLLPGAANGGAKIVVLELIKQFGRLAPDCKIVLLTSARTHNELAAFESGNITRRRWTDHTQRFSRIVYWRDRVLRRLPPSLHHALFKLRKILPLPGYYKPSQLDCDLLFFPFGLSRPARGFDWNFGSIPSVAAVYDLQHRAYPEFFPAAEFAERQRCLEFHKQRAVFIVISNFVRDSMIAQVGIAPDAVFTAYIRLHARMPQVDAGVVRLCLHKLQLTERRYFVYPANFWRHKNHEMLLTAFAMARAGKLPLDIKLVCTGSPDERMAEVADASEALGLSDFVIFPGFLADAEFAALLRSSIGVVFPSLYEGFGMPVIEAMAAGSPVACSDRASLPEIAGDAALLFDPRKPAAVAEAMSRLATDEELRSDLIAKGQRRADQFSQVEEMAREYWGVFERTLRNKSDNLLVTGIYADGWAAPVFSVHVPKGSPDRTLRLEIEVPGWLMIKEFDLKFVQQTLPRPFHATVRRGRQQLDVLVQEAAGRIDVHVRPFFRPCELPSEMSNPDMRPLTVMIGKMELHDPALDKPLVCVRQR